MPSIPGYEFTHRLRRTVRTHRSDLSLLAATLRDRGSWTPVLMDAEARRRLKAGGLRIAERLNELGVDVYCAHAETGAMVEEIANRLSTGRLRVRDHLEEWFAGYRRYRRDEKGEIDETDDHLVRATGLMLVHGLGLGKTEAHAASNEEGFDPIEYERTHLRATLRGSRSTGPQEPVNVGRYRGRLRPL